MKILRYILISPIALMMILFDLIKFPLVLVFFGPLWLLLDLIDITKGEKSQFFPFMFEMSTMGCQMIYLLAKD